MQALLKKSLTRSMGQLLRGNGSSSWIAWSKLDMTRSVNPFSAQTGRGTRNTGIIAVAVFDEKVKASTSTVVIHQQPIVIERPVYPPWWVRPYRPWWPRYPDVMWAETIGTTTGIRTTSHVVQNACQEEAPYQANMIQCSMSADPSATPTMSAKGMASEPAKAMMGTQQEMSKMDLGTGYGREVEMHTTSMSFERASSKPVLEIVIRYGTRERLAALGVPVAQAAAPAQPAPAPDPFPGSSCPAPPGWTG